MGWSRSEKTIEGVECLHGTDGLDAVLRQSDYLIGILPSTKDTYHLLDAFRLRLLKRNCIVINVGRGDLIDETALLTALDQNQLNGAILDVFEQEPLPSDSPFWTHPKVTVTPHVSGWSLDNAFEDIANNYNRLLSGDNLLHEVDRGLGY